MHTSGFISPILTHNTTPSFSVLCDSAFPRNDPSLVGKLVRARKVNEMGKSSDTPNCTYLAAVDVLLERAIPSERQSVEWGVRSIKGPFKRLSVPLLADSYNRYRVVVLCAHLFNFRTRFVGRNQIRTVYYRTETRSPQTGVRQ